MVDRDQQKTTPPAGDLSSKKKELISSAMRRTSEWYASDLLKQCNVTHSFGGSYLMPNAPPNLIM